jgi:hypothetical protein
MWKGRRDALSRITTAALDHPCAKECLLFFGDSCAFLRMDRQVYANLSCLSQPQVVAILTFMCFTPYDITTKQYAYTI